MTTTEANKEIVRRMNEEVWGEGNLDLVDEYVAADYLEHNTASPEDIHGREGYKANVEMVRTAFPGMEVTTENLVAEGERVAFRYTITGTHEGELMGIEPTGTEVNFSGMAIARFEDGKVVEDWSNVDLFGLMQQLGVVDPSGE
jgi:steroid delta-isomerase-like uncharacterized protein